MSLPTLPTRVTSLDANLFSFDGQDFIGSWKTFDYGIEMTTQEGQSSSSRYVKKQATKRKKTFSLTVFHPAASGTDRASNLSASVYTIGGSDYLGDLKSATLTLTTKTSEGSGAVELDSYPVAGGTDLQITASHLVSSSAALVALASQSETLSDFEVTVAFTVAGLAFSAPMLLSAASLKLTEGGAVQMEDVTFELHGDITAPTGSTTGAKHLFVLIATGTASLIYSVDTGSLTETGYALITKATLTYQDAQIVEDQFEFTCQGLGTVPEE